MAKDRIQVGGTKRFYATALDASGAYVTGLTDVLLELRRQSDGYYLDFNDGTFKNAGWTTRQQQMTETDATNSPGLYHYDVATTSYTPTGYAARASSATAANGRWEEELEVVRLLDGITFRGTCGSVGTLNSVILTGAPGPYTDFYAGAFVMMTSGFLSGAVRKITAFNASTKSATVSPNWPLSVSPASGDTYVLLPSSVISQEVWQATYASFGGVTGTYGRLLKPNDTESFVDSDFGVIITGQPHTAGATVAGVTAPVTVGTNNDKTGYDLNADQSSVTVGTVSNPVTAGTVSDKTGYALSAAGITAIWDELIDGVRKARELARGWSAVLLGKSSGHTSGASTPKYRNIADTKNVVDAATDKDGNRSSVTLDLS